MKVSRSVPLIAVGIALVGIALLGMWGGIGLAPSGAAGVTIDAVYDPEDYSEVTVDGETVGGEEANGQTLYTATLSLTGASARSEVLHFNQDTISAALFCYVTGTSSTGSESMTIELHRVSYGLIDEYVSSVTVPREGSSDATWENVGAGDYYFKFVKDDDSQTVETRSLMLYSLE